MTTNYFTINAPVLDHTSVVVYGPELFISGEITQVAPAALWVAMNEALQACAPEDALFVWLNSLGGDVTGGGGIIDMLKSCGRRLIIRVCGTASSMAAFILQAADQREITKHSHLLLHGSAWTVEDMEMRQIEVHHKYMAASEEDYLKMLWRRVRKVRPDTTMDTIREWCNGDHLFSANEAVKVGLVDVVV